MTEHRRRPLLATAARPYHLARRLWRKCNKLAIQFLRPVTLTLAPNSLKLETLGSDYGGWTIPIDLIDKTWVVYCVGVGADATFDVAITEQIGCHVYSFDPTPRSIEYMAGLKCNRDLLHFYPIGVWSEDTTLRFFSPAASAETSHSVYDLHGRGAAFTATCKTLSTIMSDLGHDRIDLLKLDIEGAWRPVIRNIVQSNLNIRVLCVEFDSPVTLHRVRSATALLGSIGLRLVDYRKHNYLFVHKSLLAQGAKGSSPVSSEE